MAVNSQVNAAPRSLVAVKAWATEQGIPYSSVRDSINRGELPVVRLGDPKSLRPRFYLRRGDAERWLESRTEVRNAIAR